MKSSSIVLTIHDKGFLLPKTLEAIKWLTHWRCVEIIFVIDGCTDNSLELVENFCKEAWQIKTTILEAPDVFETKSNNLAAKASSSDYVIFLQDDILIQEAGWNEQILRPLKKWDDVFAVSGNCAHSWAHNPATIGIDKEGWSDLLRHHSHANKFNIDHPNTFAIRESCNRGPLALDHAVFKQLNYFDEAFAPLDSDDHDLMYRAKALNKVCGYTRVGWGSENHWGGTRDENGKTKQWVLDVNIKNAQLLYNRHKDLMNTGIAENRNL